MPACMVLFKILNVIINMILFLLLMTGRAYVSARQQSRLQGLHQL